MSELQKNPETTTAGLYDQLNTAVDSIPVRRVHWLIFALVALGGLFNAIEQYNVGLAGPAIASAFGLTATLTGLLSTVTFIAMAFGSLASGYSGDRLGRKPVFLANIAIFTVGALLTALSPNYEMLLLGRILIGLGLGGEISLGFTVVAELMPTSRRGAMTAGVNFVAGGAGVFAASGLAALFFGPLASAFGGTTVAWRWYLGLMVVPALLLIVVRRYLPETPRFLLQRGRIAEANRVLTLLQHNRLRDDTSIPTTDFVHGAEGAVAGPSERPRVTELFARGVRRRTLTAWILTFALFGAGVTLVLSMSSVLVGRGLDIATSLGYTMITTFGGLVGTLIGVLLAHRMPRRLTLICGGLLNVVCAAGLFLSPSIAVALISAAVMNLGFNAMLSVNMTYMTELFPTRLRALGTGSAFFIGLLAAGLGPLGAGAVMDSFGDPGMFVALALICLLIAGTGAAGPETASRPLDTPIAATA